LLTLNGMAMAAAGGTVVVVGGTAAIGMAEVGTAAQVSPVRYSVWVRRPSLAA
jgi:hypothetical protein